MTQSDLKLKKFARFVMHIIPKHTFAKLHSKKRLHTQTLQMFERLSSLLEAGLPIEQCLTYLHNHSKKKTNAFIVSGLQAIQNGQSLSMAWRNFLPPLFHSALQTGEYAGHLTKVMNEQVHRAKRLKEWRNELVKLISYPIFLLLFTLMLLIYISTQVLPEFIKMYQEFGQKPSETIILIEHVLWALPKTIFSVIFIMVCILTIWFLIIKKSKYMKWIETKFDLFFWFRLHRTQILTANLNILVSAGIPLIDALNILSYLDAPEWLKITGESISLNILSGKSIRQSFSGPWDPLLDEELHIAEKTGDLQRALSDCEFYCQTTLIKSVEKSMKMAEPVLLIGMGIIIGLTMYVVFMPMYNFISVISTNKIH